MHSMDGGMPGSDSLSVAAVTGAVLAGGRSRRMGSNKALLPCGGQRLIEHVLDVLRPLFPELLIAANEPAPYAALGVPVHPDRIPDKGPLGGIYTALASSSHPRTFCLACDMPLANAAVIARLCSLAPAFDVVVPHSPKGYEPLHAVYSRACLPALEVMLRKERLRVDELFSAVRVYRVDVEDLRPLDPRLTSFLNVNTPAELAAAATLFQERGKTPCGR
jgi:molybdopterin-guanine dinucleotide biosynthesis protein A